RKCSTQQERLRQPPKRPGCVKCPGLHAQVVCCHCCSVSLRLPQGCPSQQWSSIRSATGRVHQVLDSQTCEPNKVFSELWSQSNNRLPMESIFRDRLRAILKKGACATRPPGNKRTRVATLTRKTTHRHG